MLKTLQKKLYGQTWVPACKNGDMENSKTELIWIDNSNKNAIKGAYNISIVNSTNFPMNTNVE